MAAHISGKRRVLFAFLAATVLVAITSVPSMVSAAPAKKYSLIVDSTSPATVTVGQSTRVTLKLTNETPPGTNSNPSSFYVTVPFPISGAITFPPTVAQTLAGSSNPNLSATVGIDPENSSRILVKSLDAINKSQFVKLTFTVTPASCTQSAYNWILDALGNPTLVKVVNGASLNGDTFSPTSTNVTTSVSCAPPSLSVTKTAVDASILVGGDAQFDITVSNAAGSGIASNVGVSDTLPTGLTWSILTQTANACDILSGELICTIPTLAGGASYSVRIEATTSALGTVTNDGVTVSLNGSPVAITDGPASVDVFETTIACGGTVSASGGGTDVDVTLVNDEGCTPKDATVTATTSEDPDFQHLIQILASGSGGQVTFVVDTTWAQEEILPTEPIPYSTVIPDCAPGPSCDPTDPTNRETEVWCDGAFDPLEAPSPTNPDGTYGASMPPGHSWCRITQDTQIAEQVPGDNLKRVHEISLLINADPAKGRS